MIDWILGQSHPPPPPGAPVVITGADRGIGRGVAIELAQRHQLRVLAGCLTPQACQELSALAAREDIKIVPFVLDVTRAEDVAQCEALVARTCPDGVFALVNNAGILRMLPAAWQSPTDYERTMQINFHGAVRMTLALLPHMLKTKGRSRIINMCSYDVHFVHPHTSAYAASKAALHAFSAALRLEMHAWNIPVIVISPSGIRSDMLREASTHIRQGFKHAPAHAQAMYGEAYADALGDRMDSALDMPLVLIEPAHVVALVANACTATRPRNEYLMGLDTYIFGVLQFILPRWAITWIARTMARLSVAPATALRAY